MLNGNQIDFVKFKIRLSPLECGEVETPNDVP
jgi:hypothetical protein